MKPEVYFDEKLGVLRIKVVGQFTAGELAESISSINELFELKKTRNILADIADSARELPSKEERKSMAEMAKGIDWDKIAVIGADPVLRITSKVILAFMGKFNEARFFKTSEGAIDWLRGETR